MTTLTVPFDEFASAVERHQASRDVYLSEVDDMIIVSSMQVELGFHVCATTEYKKPTVIKKLSEKGLSVVEGSWSAGSPASTARAKRSVYVAGVSYRSSTSEPGIWLDGFFEKPSDAQVLRAFYDDLVKNGEIPEVAFDKFINDVKASVAILHESDLYQFAHQKEDHND